MFGFFTMTFFIFGHDRDYRTLVAHPLAELADLGLAVLRLDAYLRPSVEVLCGAQYTGKAADTRWVLIHKGHMRLWHPDCPRAPPLGSRELDAVGWEAYLENGRRPRLCLMRQRSCSVTCAGPIDNLAPFAPVARLALLVCRRCAPHLPKLEPWLAPSPVLLLRRLRQPGRNAQVCLPPERRSLSCLSAMSGCGRPGATVASLRSDVDLHDAIAYLGEGGVDLLWLLPDTLFQGPAHQLWRPALQLAATHLQAGGRCVVEAPLYRRAWSDKFARAQLAGALWHATRQPGPVFGASGPGLTMLRLSFAVPPDLFPVFDAWVSDGAGGAGASANFDLEEASHTLWKELTPADFPRYGITCRFPGYRIPRKREPATAGAEGSSLRGDPLRVHRRRGFLPI